MLGIGSGIPIYNDTIENMEINLDRELNLNTEANLEENYMGSIQEYILGLNTYKNFEWQFPIFIHIRIAGHLLFKGKQFSQNIDYGEV